MAKFKVMIPAGPIWNQEDAEKKCPIVCAAHLGTWTGVWNTVVPSAMSVCECEFDTDNSGKNVLELEVIGGRGIPLQIGGAVGVFGDLPPVAVHLDLAVVLFAPLQVTQIINIIAHCKRELVGG